MSEEDNIFQPAEDLEETSKMSLLSHISHRLKLSECLPCKKGNGALSTDETRL